MTTNLSHAGPSLFTYVKQLIESIQIKEAEGECVLQYVRCSSVLVFGLR